MTPYSDSQAWSDYAILTLREAESAADLAGISERLHLWPDHEGLYLKSVIESQPDPEEYLNWLRQWWSRVSEWPGK